MPSGYVPIPVAFEELQSALRLCVLFKLQGRSANDGMVVLRDLSHAQVFLGCVTDATGRVRDWVELWVQRTLGTADPQGTDLPNAVLDERWHQEAGIFDLLERKLTLKTSWEASHPPPLFIDPKTRSPVHPVDPHTAERWVICDDDPLLLGADLPSYAASQHRYLHLPSLGQRSQFSSGVRSGRQ